MSDEAGGPGPSLPTGGSEVDVSAVTQAAADGRLVWAPPWVRERVDRATTWFDDIRTRVSAIDVGMRVYERDKDAAGTLLGSALSLRLFLFFVPLVLFAVGMAGVFGHYFGVGTVSGDVGISGSLANEIDHAFDQGSTTPWFALLAGLLGIATAGRSLTRALVLSSALSWRLGGKQKTPMRAVGVVVGIVVGMALVATLLNRVRAASGVAVTSVSFIAVAAIYIVMWSMLYLALPRGTTDPGAALPGASVVAVSLAGLQAVTQLYMPGQIESASAIYGTIGIAIATLGWFFIIGRVMAFSFALNAVLFEQIGSLSRVVFGLPGLRGIPAKLPALARFFDLEATVDHDR